MNPEVNPERPPAWAPPAPPPTLRHSARLTLRPYTPADARALYDAIAPHRDAYLPWLPWVRFCHLSPDDTDRQIERFMNAWTTWPMSPEDNTQIGFILGVFDRLTGSLVAGTGFNRIEPDRANAEVGYWVHPAHRRKGYAAELTASLLSWGLLPQTAGGWGFRRIHIFANGANAASVGVPSRLGLRQELHAHHDRWEAGLGWCDTLGWGVLASEWDTAHDRLRSPTDPAHPGRLSPG
jgi:RimJ/RimL family protein N-acetyltransferase